MNQVIKIGTRESELAVWQAKKVQQLLHSLQIPAELVYIKSEGDINLTSPLYEIGVQGIFTKALDIALLNKDIDLAVHSYKDVPTQLPEGMVKAAVLKRDSHKDVLIYKADDATMQRALGWNKEWKDIPAENTPFIIATSSIRRKAQWLRRYPHHSIDNLRGNVNKRLAKLAESSWDAAIFAAAGLERINLRPENCIDIDWMLPAPAQGTVVAVCRTEDLWLQEKIQVFNDEYTDICTAVERSFLRHLYGGCTTPISALATINNAQVHFEGNITSVDGTELVEVQYNASVREAAEIGKIAADTAMQKGAGKIIEAIRNNGQ